MTEPDPQGPAEAGRFATTRWTVVANAADPGSPLARQALAELCRAYWYPLYAFLRRRGEPPDRAEDLTQGFFADLLDRGSLAAVDRANGRFRSFLLAALEHFLANRRDWERRLKRGGRARHLSIDLRDAEGRYLREPAHGATPERIFERRWALTLLGHVLDRLEGEMAGQGKGPLFERLKPALLGDPGHATAAGIGAETGLAEGAVRVAVHRLRKRYRALLREEIARTVADPAQVEQEIRDLFAALGP